LLVVGLDGEGGVSSTLFSMQIITNRFSTVVSASPQDNADMCLLSSSIRSELTLVPTGEAWENTEREMNAVYLPSRDDLQALHFIHHPVSCFWF
jgi:hypothetical protein